MTYSCKSFIIFIKIMEEMEIEMNKLDWRIEMERKEGTKNNPVKIYVVYDFHVTCPKCEENFPSTQADKKVKCPGCKKIFYTDFDLHDCGI